MLIPWPYPDEGGFRPEPPGLAPDDEDTRLTALVAQRLSSDWSTRRQQIVVTVQNRVVILAGIVAGPDTRQVAGEIAWDVRGVVDVCNALRLVGSRRSRH
ncbi:BON domain-containing protein [Micromonospora peucetia]|uniref:BON domain-containing protein n=1 Tax=Micromonospora peucetia TaxID=47871 RepID=A0A1C6VXF4_9ACTN|nr:BON domain-containing protein [Micromonospora peucetia]WSA31484.1 BON domain-containing protein [Micromonospora peucetia]SCL71019.1 BON domain-containing protein [Micromonospora peucetia]